MKLKEKGTPCAKMGGIKAVPFSSSPFRPFHIHRHTFTVTPSKTLSGVAGVP